MPPTPFLGAWLGTWLVFRALLSLPHADRLIRRLGQSISCQREWWRVVLRWDGDGAGGLVERLTPPQRRFLRRWFFVGAAAGLLTGAASILLLAGELWALLPAVLPAPGGADATARAAAEAGAARPRLQLALPGVTLPGSHALPLWLALAASLAFHEAGHALAAAAEGVAVNGAGASLMLLVPAAFVELDSAELDALSGRSMLSVAAAGAWHNTALALACWAALFLLAVVTPASAAGGVAGGAGSAGNVAALETAVLGFWWLALGYTASISVALALLNMAPVHFLDGEQALKALLLRPASRPKREGALPEQGWEGSRGAGASSRREAAVRWCLHAGTALYAAVVVLHLARMK